MISASSRRSWLGIDVVTTVVLLSVVPLAARRFFGPAYPSRLARILRASGYAAVLALMPAKAVVEQFAYTVPHGGGQLSLYRNVPGGLVLFEAGARTARTDR